MAHLRGARCRCCSHPERWRLELLRAGGASLDSLAEKFGLGRDSVARHWRDHVSPELKASYLAGPSELATLMEKAAKEGDSVIDYLRLCRTTLTAQLAAMAEAGDGRGAALVAGQLTRTLEVIGRVTGELGELARGNLTINNNVILNSPAFAAAQATILRALAPFHEARMAVVKALRDLDTEQPVPAIAAPTGHLIEAVAHAG